MSVRAWTLGSQQTLDLFRLHIFMMFMYIVWLCAIKKSADYFVDSWWIVFFFKVSDTIRNLDKEVKRLKVRRVPGAFRDHVSATTFPRQDESHKALDVRKLSGWRLLAGLKGCFFLTGKTVSKSGGVWIVHVYMTPFVIYRLLPLPETNEMLKIPENRPNECPKRRGPSPQALV